MAFEKFTKVGRSFKPEVTLRRSGMIGINKGAIQRFALSRFRCVVLYYDPDTHRIGIQPVKDEGETGAVTLRIKEGNGSVSAVSFLESYKISYKEAPKYDGIWDEKEQMIVVDLKRPKE